MRIIPPLFTAKTIKTILDGKSEVSLDLGFSVSKVTLDSDELILPGGVSIKLFNLLKAQDRENAVFFPKDGELFLVAISSSHLFKLLPTDDAPTMEIDGVRMHRTKDTTPLQDTKKKLDVLGLHGGRVLDTCTGLGYTASAAAHRSTEVVVTIELESSVLKICEMNPWSQGLYNKKVNQILGDSFYVLDAFPKAFFNWIIHDPPRLTLAGHLYSGAFYEKLYRVLVDGGKLLHYTGEPGSRHRGINLQKGIKIRLRNAGFKSLNYHPNAMVITCEK